MRAFRLTLLAVALLCVSAESPAGFKRTFMWPAPIPVEQVSATRLYDNGALVKEVPQPANTVTIRRISPGTHTFTATFVNATGEGPPSPPLQVIIKKGFTIQVIPNEEEDDVRE